jgi:hypothetical protein
MSKRERNNNSYKALTGVTLLGGALVFSLIVGAVFAPHIRDREVLVVDADKGDLKSRVANLESSFNNLSKVLEATSLRYEAVVRRSSPIQDYSRLINSLTESNKQMEDLVKRVETLTKIVEEQQ